MYIAAKTAIPSLLICAAGIAVISCGSQPTQVNTIANEAVASNARANRPVKSSAAAVQVADGREERSPTSNPADNALVEKEFKAKESEILKASSFECDPGSKGLEVLGSASGAFTKAGAAQKAYLYERCRAGRSFGIGGLLIKEGDAVVAHYVFGENGLYTSVGKADDINKNGTDEIILAGGGTGQGYTESSISLFEFASGNQTFLGRTQTYSDNSGAADDDSKVLTTAYKVMVVPDTNPTFSHETFEKHGKEKTWSETKKTEKVQLEKNDAPKMIKIS